MKLTRRAVAATGLAALAGCLSDDDGDTDTNDPDSTDDETELGGGGSEEIDQSDTIELEGEDVLPVPVAGDPDADVTVAVFEDFACSACQHYKQNLYPELKDEYIDPETIRYEHRDFPIPVDGTWSWAIAGAARSVQDRYDDDAFFEFATAIYDEQGEYSYDVVESVADDLDLDGEAIRQETEDNRFRQELDQERARAADAGVSATPTIVVDGEAVDPDIDLIGEAIDAALE